MLYYNQMIGKVDKDSVPIIATFDEDAVEEIAAQIIMMIQIKLYTDQRKKGEE